uniref:Pentatricopeptide repeat-containing protein At4g16390ic n=1 Tax=Rhizophora mucronata TaxID=61149 RepID=A0A2P2MU85_RHIMU
MTYNLCSSSYSLYQRLCNSCSSWADAKPPRNFNSLKLNCVSPQSRTASLQITHCSIQEATRNANLEYPDAKTASSSSSSKSSYIWVNPNSPRASQLKKRSYDSRYASLVKSAEALDSCNVNKDDVFGVLNGLGDDLFEQDAVVIEFA